MRKFFLLLCSLTLFFTAQPAGLAEEAAPKTYRYWFTLNDKLSCSGSSTLSPEMFAAYIKNEVGPNGFVQLKDFATGDGEKASVGFVNPRCIVRFWLLEE